MTQPPVGPWAADAACRGLDPDTFFPVDEVGEERAQEVCATCNQADACLDYAMRHDERYGVWGGMTEGQRREYRNEWRAINARPVAVAAPKRARVPNGRVKCGTFSGYVTHRKLGQAACDPCKAAAAEYQRNRRAGGKRHLGALPAGADAPRVADLCVLPSPASSTTDYDPAGVLDRQWFSTTGEVA